MISVYYSHPPLYWVNILGYSWHKGCAGGVVPCGTQSALFTVAGYKEKRFRIEMGYATASRCERCGAAGPSVEVR